MIMVKASSSFFFPGTALSYKNTMRYTDNAVWNCTPETYIILLIDVNTIS